MDQYVHYIESIAKDGTVKSNGSAFIINHNNRNLLLTAAHTIRKYNEDIFPDFKNWHAREIGFSTDRLPLYNGKKPIFSYFHKTSSELLDAVSLPFNQDGGQIDYDARIGDSIKLCGWRNDPDKKKFIFDGTIIDIDGWHIIIRLLNHVHLKRDGISGGGIYSDKGFVGVYYADDIGKDTSHGVSINWMMGSCKTK